MTESFSANVIEGTQCVLSTSGAAADLLNGFMLQNVRLPIIDPDRDSV
jgi:hypothetical protein